MGKNCVYRFLTGDCTDTWHIFINKNVHWPWCNLTFTLMSTLWKDPACKKHCLWRLWMHWHCDIKKRYQLPMLKDVALWVPTVMWTFRGESFCYSITDSWSANPQILISPSSTLASENARSLSLCCVHTAFSHAHGFDRGIVCVHSCYSHMFNCPKQQVYCTVHTLEHRSAIWRFLGGGPAPVDIIIIIMLLF